jgi:prepilin-type N-terminal cleavage/methylation domain-containing protein
VRNCQLSSDSASTYDVENHVESTKGEYTKMKRAMQAGFTLIELVVVIVILGILAAVAIPQFTDMTLQARNAVAAGACGALQSSAVMLYASKTGQGSTATQIVANTTVSGGSFTGSGCTQTFTPSGTGAVAVACPTAIPAPLCTGP